MRNWQVVRWLTGIGAKEVSARRRAAGPLILVAALLAVPVVAYAQDATLTGTVKDSSGGVLPGVTVTALHEASGNTFVGVTDGGGGFRLLMRTGAYKITVELPGFATVVRTTNLLLGQTATV
ncbi:MAG: carboxypeptidase regulatory-like domain-containing protein, partial [Acidobacteria bacterium]|nr:carboxypeptidase regulatory-like domain-containing protein [Acidobacteriota bacterium]